MYIYTLKHVCVCIYSAVQKFGISKIFYVFNGVSSIKSIKIEGKKQSIYTHQIMCVICIYTTIQKFGQ